MLLEVPLLYYHVGLPHYIHFLKHCNSHDPSICLPEVEEYEEQLFLNVVIHRKDDGSLVVVCFINIHTPNCIYKMSLSILTQLHAIVLRTLIRRARAVSHADSLPAEV